MSKQIKTLLLVEDDELLAMTETRWLKKAGYEVIHASSGEEAIEKINAEGPGIDLILMDINLGPGIDGTDAAREILKKHDIPLLFLSSHTEKEVVEKTEKITSYGYVVKDSKDVVLLASIKMAFKLFNANRALKEKEKALLKSEARQNRAEFISHAGNWELHLKGDKMIISEGAAKVFGLNSTEVKYQDIQKLVIPAHRKLFNQALKNLIEKGEPYNIVFKIRKAGSGEFTDIRSTAEYEKVENIVIGVIKDITKRKIAEDALKYERNLLRLLIDNVPDLISLKDSDGLYLLNNSSHLKAIGAGSQDEVTGKDPTSFFPPELAAEFMNEERELLRTGKPIINKEETRINKTTGEKTFHIITKIPVLDEEGNISGLIGISRNITSIKNREIKLKESEEKYRKLFESETDAHFLIESASGKILEANNASCILLGYSYDELLKMSNYDLSAEPEKTKEDNEAQKNSKTLITRVLKKKDGTTFYAELSRSHFDIDGRMVHLTSIRDISIHKRIEQELLESELKWKSAIEGNNQGLWDWNIVTGQVYFSPLWKKMLGYEEEEIPHHLDSWSNLVHPEDLAATLEILNRHLRGETKEYSSEHRLLCKDGSYKWILDQGKVFSYDSEGNPLRMIGTHTDISARKIAEEKLGEMSEIFRLFLKYNPFYTFIKDSEIKPIYLSENYERMLNRPLSEILGKTMDELFPSELSRKMIEDDKQILKEGAYKEFTEELNGRTYTTIKFPIFIKGKAKYLAGYTIDITDRTRVEKELEHQKRFFEQMYLQSATSTQILDKEGWCLRINPKLSEIFGVKPEDIEGHVYNIFEDAEIKRNGIDKILRRVFDEKRTEKWEVHFDIGNAAESQNIKVKEKTKVWYSVTASPILDPEGNLLYVVVQHEDITKRKQAEEELKESQQIFAAAFHNSSALISLTTVDEGIYIDVNETFLRVSGYSRDEVIGSNPLKLNIYDNPADRVRLISELKQKGYLYGFECRFRRRSGEVFVSIISGVIIAIKGESCFLATVVDITDRIKMEDGLKKFKMSLEHSEDAIFITNEKGEIEYLNNAFETIYGFSRDEVLGKTPRIIKSGLLPENEYNAFWQRLLSNQSVIGEIRNKRKDGKIITVEGSNNPILDEQGKVIGFLGIHRDITARKRDEEIQKIIFNVSASASSTRNIEEFISLVRDQLGKMVDTTNFYVAFYDEETDTLSTPFVKDEKDEISTWPAEKSLTGLVVKRDRSMILTREDTTRMKNEGIIDFIGTPSEIWVGVPLKVDGKVIGAIVLQDYHDRHAFDAKSIEILEFVSEQISLSLHRKQIENELQEKQNILNEAQRIAQLGSWNADLETGKFSWSDEMFRVFDVSPYTFDPSFKTILEMIHPEDRKIFEDSIEKQFKGEMENGVEFRIMTNTNSIRYLSLTGAPTFDKNGLVNGAIGAVQNITSRKETEFRLQKYMEELRETSATKDKFFSIISHDLKNPFHSINGALNILLNDEEPLSDEERKTFLTGLQNTSNRAYSLLENLMLWSRNQMGQIEFIPERIQLYEIAISTIELVQNSSAIKKIVLGHKVSEELFVTADRNMLETVLRNLLTNAIKFTAEYGKVEITAQQEERFIRVTVIDNGVGIHEEDISKLFRIDKTFSTKGTKNETGTGLGLILCKDFIKRNGGEINVESEPGKGSRFSFTLPRG